VSPPIRTVPRSTQVSVYIADVRDVQFLDGAAPSSLVVEIRPTVTGTALVFGGNDGQTTTLVPAQDVLATQTIAGSAIPRTYGWVTVTFACPAIVAAGTRYALVLRGTTTTLVAWTEGRGPNGSDLYPAGQAFEINGYLATWSVSDLTSPPGPIHDDLLFQTFVSP